MYKFDLRETIISFSMLQITNAFNKMKSGEVMEIIGCDQSIPKELEYILPESEYEIFYNEILDPGGSDFRMKLRKIKP